MKTFAIGTFSRKSGSAERFAGIVIDHQVAVLSDLAREYNYQGLVGRSVLSLLETWDASLRDLKLLLAEVPVRGWFDEEDLVFHSPVDLPRQVFCTGANYRKHVVDLTVDSGVGPEGLNQAELRQWAEDMMDLRVAEGEPYVFTKPVSAISGAYDELVLPPTTTKPDWELELAVVIGKEAYNIGEEEALDYVAGYTIVNDVSARDLIPRTDYKMLGTDWLRSKGQPGFLPVGPYLVPKEFIADPYNLSLKLTVSGRLMQDETTADMLFSIEQQIAYISRYAKLLPGDIICTGSPAGNGTHYDRYLTEGDVMVGDIAGLGRQRQICVLRNGRR